MDNNNRSRTTEQELQAFVTLWKQYRAGEKESSDVKSYVYFLKEKDGVTFRRLAALTGHEVSPQYFNKIHKQFKQKKGGENK